MTLADKLKATHLRGTQWAVSPYGQLGTIGWHPVAWEIVIVRARNDVQAMERARTRIIAEQPKLAKAIELA